MHQRLRKTRSTGESACPTALQLVDFLRWGRRFRLPIAASNDFFRTLVSLGLRTPAPNPKLTHGAGKRVFHRYQSHSELTGAALNATGTRKSVDNKTPAAPIHNVLAMPIFSPRNPPASAPMGNTPRDASCMAAFTRPSR